MAAETLAVAAPPDPLTFEEFLTAYDGVHAEWVDGRVYVMSPGNTPQSRLTRFLTTVLQIWAETNDAGEALAPPLTVKLPGSAREPDVFFVRKEDADRLQRTYYDGPPALVVEIISPDSVNVDRGEKFYEYEQGGVPEYWVIDPARKKADCWRLGADGTYEPVPLGTPATLTCLTLPGMSIPAEWLWQEPLPHITDVQKAWGLI